MGCIISLSFESSSSSLFTVSNTGYPYVSTSVVIDVLFPSNFSSGSSSPSLYSSIYTSYRSYIDVDTPVVTVLILVLASSASYLFIFLIPYSTIVGPGAIFYFIFPRLVVLPLAPYVLSLLTELKLYIIIMIHAPNKRVTCSCWETPVLFHIVLFWIFIPVVNLYY